MEITTTGTEEQRTVHFDTRLTFVVDQDGKVEGNETFTEQELYDMLVKSNEPEDEEETVSTTATLNSY